MVILRNTAAMTQPEIRLKMPNWYYDKEALRTTPSYNDGISNAKEAIHRRAGATSIQEVGKLLNLKCETWASGVVYFHRFYMFHSFKQFPRTITACCCLLLAGKVEETPKKCKQIIATAQQCLSAEDLSYLGDNPREEVMTLERILLKTIKFDLQISHPYEFLMKYTKAIRGDKETRKKVVQMAWNFVNDSLKSTLCLQWEPEIIGIAAMYLASRLLKFNISDWEGRTPSQRNWWESFASEVSVQLLEDICHQILDIYNTDQKRASAEEREETDGPIERMQSLSPPERPRGETKSLTAPPMPPNMGTAPPPPLPKEPPQFFAPPPTEPPPNFAPPLPPPIPPLAAPNAISSQTQPASHAFSHLPPPHVLASQGNLLHSRPMGASSVAAPYPPHGYYIPPVPAPQDYSAPPPPPSHQFYQNNSTRHLNAASNRQSAQNAGGPVRDHYRPSHQSHHPYMRGQGPPYIMPPQRR